MHNSTNYVVIDDDCTGSLQFKMIIKYHETDEEEHTPITVGENGIDFLDIARSMPRCPVNTVLVKDIQIPGATVREFLERVNKFPDEMKEKFKVFILSSSVDNADREIALSHPMVKGYLVKPLSRADIMDIISGKIEEND